jgi:uncharacterized protein (DUF433 family)
LQQQVTQEFSLILYYLTDMNYTKYIESNAEVMLDKPVVKGTRVSVALILKKLSEGATIQDLTVAYPDLSETSIKAVLAYAYDVIANETVIAVA